MNVIVTDYLDVETRALELHLQPPRLLAILPRGFDAGSAGPPAHESHSATIRKLLKESGVPSHPRELAQVGDRNIHTKAEAQAVLDEVRTMIRAGTFDARGQAPREVIPMTSRQFADI